MSVSAARLMGNFASSGAVAGLALVLVFIWAQPRINAHRAEALNSAVGEVLDRPARIETWFVVDGKLTPHPTGKDTVTLDRVYAGLNEAGERTGVAILGAQPGFTDQIHLIFGFDPRTQRIIGMKVLEARETPGLGDKIMSDTAFTGQFNRIEALLHGVKRGTKHANAHDIDLITGATVSSRTVVAIINRRVSELKPLLDAMDKAP